jgi:hypothetical protein
MEFILTIFNLFFITIICIFCTPFGWVGLTIFGIIIYSILELKNKK